MKINTYHFQRFVFFFQDFLWSFIGLILPRRKRIIFNSSHNDNFSFNSRYLFLHFLSEEDAEVYFVIRDELKREKLNLKHGEFFIGNQKTHEKLFILMSKIWVTSTMETPVMGFFHGFRRYVLHLSHGVVFKKAGVAENKLSVLKKVYYKICKTNFSEYIATSENLRKATAQVYGVSAEKIIISGFPRNDKCKFIKKEKRKVLYAPTWRKTGSVRWLPCKDEQETELIAILDRHEIELCIRQHPLFEENKKIKLVEGRVSDFSSKVCPDINEKLNEFCAVITDYSSIFIDALWQDSQVAFYPYDLESYNNEVGFMFDYESFLSGRIISDIDGLDSFFTSLNSSQKDCSDLKGFFYDSFECNASERLSRMLISKL